MGKGMERGVEDIDKKEANRDREWKKELDMAERREVEKRKNKGASWERVLHSTGIKLHVR